uniref:Uncharacterized protein n=1 Tax=Rangifer tarandus platyrhynchus TaxID=3082113 RepID=A0ACB0DYK8_RANTA|nr:unnamed protein product [Rangifer tarandus platyrhynchus]
MDFTCAHVSVSRQMDNRKDVHLSVTSILSSYKVTPAKGSCHSMPLQTPISSGLDECSGSVWPPDMLLP